MPKTQVCLPAAWRWLRERRAMQRKLDEGFAGAQATAERLNYNLTHDVDIDRRILPEPPPDVDPGARALQKKIIEGRAFAAEMAERLNYNVTHNVDPDRRIQPERPRIPVIIRILKI